MLTLGKWIISAILAVFALIATVAAVGTALLLFNDEWQTAGVDAFFERATGWRWDFGTANVGWNRFAATQVFAMQHGQGLEVREVDLQLRTLSLIQRDPIRVEGGSLRGCFIDLSTLPGETLGFTLRDLRSMPPSDDARVAVEQMILLGLERLQMSDLELEVRDVRMEGSVLLPARRSLEFDVMIENASTARPEELRMLTTRAVFR